MMMMVAGGTNYTWDMCKGDLVGQCRGEYGKVLARPNKVCRFETYEARKSRETVMFGKPSNQCLMFTSSESRCRSVVLKWCFHYSLHQ